MEQGLGSFKPKSSKNIFLSSKSSNSFMSEVGMTFGVGIPVGNMFSNLNLALEVGKRGTTDANLVEEKFANLKMSLSLNDRWFVKRKYN
jgi:hypothetical protein